MEKENKSKFAHLHTHTEYSILDSSNKIKKYVARIKELGMTAAAITDHGVMYGVIEFYKTCLSMGIKPIIGCEVYVAPESRFHKDTQKSERKYYHLVLLAENNTGYANLIKIVSKGFTEGYYYKPRVDETLLREFHEGLIACSACIAGEFAQAAQIDKQKAVETALKYQEIFGKQNYYLEIQDHKDGNVEQQTANKMAIEISKELNIPLIATNDIHYTFAEDAAAHEVLLCMQQGKKLSDPNHTVYVGGQYYVKSEEEMRELFPYAPEAIENTMIIADRCNVTLEFGNYKIPEFQLPETYTSSASYLESLCIQGYEKKYQHNSEYDENKKSEILEDIKYELNMIEKMGFTEYILIVWDYINWAIQHDCWVGPGRGSAAGSKVCYCIGITNVDPVKYKLLFERFLNPERVSMPDIDVDFEYTERQRVIDEYICPRYGYDKVSQIITFQTMLAKAVIKDVGKVLNIPYSETSRISAMIPSEIGTTIEKAISLNPELRQVEQASDLNKEWFEYAKKLEGLPKATSLHAAGVVIYPTEADSCMPQAKTPDGPSACQYNMVQLEELGYLKMDFLGLRTLGVEKKAVQMIKKNHHVNIDINNIDYNDLQVLEFIGSGKTNGVFQLESSGMQKFMKELKPKSFEDVIAGISLYRPGPMDYIPDYIKGKNNPDDIEYDCPQLEPILKSTYGCTVYQGATRS